MITLTKYASMVYDYHNMLKPYITSESSPYTLLCDNALMYPKEYNADYIKYILMNGIMKLGDLLKKERQYNIIESDFYEFMSNFIDRVNRFINEFPKYASSNKILSFFITNALNLYRSVINDNEVENVNKLKEHPVIHQLLTKYNLCD